MFVVWIAPLRIGSFIFSDEALSLTWSSNHYWIIGWTHTLKIWGPSDPWKMHLKCIALMVQLDEAQKTIFKSLARWHWSWHFLLNISLTEVVHRPWKSIGTDWKKKSEITHVAWICLVMFFYGFDPMRWKSRFFHHHLGIFFYKQI